MHRRDVERHQGRRRQRVQEASFIRPGRHLTDAAPARGRRVDVTQFDTRRSRMTAAPFPRPRPIDNFLKSFAV
jgi:hypothetical protein